MLRKLILLLAILMVVIVSHDFAMRGVKPEQVVDVTSGQNSYEHKVFMWRTPLQMVPEGQSDSSE